MAINLNDYLRRISFQGKLKADHKILGMLHRKHLQTVPFENLDIGIGRKIELNLEKLEKKIVSNMRGGFCYELNGLFYALLKEIGFEVRMISAKVYGDKKIGQEFDHMALVVSLDEDWLVDVGFGDSFLEPIRIELEIKQKGPGGYFVIREQDATYLRLEASKDDLDYEPKYLFSLAKRQLKDFAGMCNYHQTSAESSFTREHICTLATDKGRVTLRDNNFIETIDGFKTIKDISNDEEYDQILRDRFQIEIVPIEREI